VSVSGFNGVKKNNQVSSTTTTATAKKNTKTPTVINY